MPTSFADNISQIMIELMKLPKPTSILDIGAGYGKFGVLCREYLDEWDDQKGWSIQIDAVEGFPKYLDRMYELEHIDTDAQAYGAFSDVWEVNYLTWRHKHYDLILMIDVLEHFTKEDGWKVLDKARSLSDNVFISTPTLPGEQGAEYGNDLERHLSKWSHVELKQRYADNWQPIDNYISVMGFLS